MVGKKRTTRDLRSASPPAMPLIARRADLGSSPPVRAPLARERRPISNEAALDFLLEEIRGLVSKPESVRGKAEALVRHPDLRPTHPGAMLRDIIVPGTNQSKTEIAKRLGVSRQTLHDLLAERQTVTPQLALRLGKLFGDGPEPWLRMQMAHDIWIANREMVDALAAIDPITNEHGERS